MFIYSSKSTKAKAKDKASQEGRTDMFLKFYHS